MKIIPLASVEVRKRQRRSIAPKPLIELKESILSVGLLHPPVMWFDRTASPPKWVLSVGERRLRAIQELNKQTPIPHFNCGEADVPPGHIAITPLGDYLDEVGRFEAELDENIRREEIPWQDRVQAMADLHAMRVATNPKQTVRATAQELLDRGAIQGRGEERSQSDSTARLRVSAAVTIAEHLDDTTIANARNENEALALILKKQEEKALAELARRAIIKMSGPPLIEVRHGDLLTMLPSLPGSSQDLVLSDPPYGQDVNSSGLRSRTVHHHNYQDDADYARTLARMILTEGFRITRPRANLFLFCHIKHFDWLKQVAAQAGWTVFERPLIWWKSHSEGLAPWGAQGPRITTEFILFATKGQRGLIASPIDVFDFRRVPRGERTHGAEKPVDLLKALIECSTLPGESVLDPCCGSGSTLVAARDTKRLALGIEKDETYYNTAMSNVHSVEVSNVPPQSNTTHQDVM